MAMVCPQCGGSHEQRLNCPACGGRLAYRLGSGTVPKPQVARPRWQQTPWGRIVIGLVLAQGLYYGLQHLVLGLLMSLSTQGLWQLAWTSTYGILLFQGLQLISLLLGGILAGGGQRRGPALEAMVGAWNGVLAVFIEPLLHPDFVPALTVVALLGQPLLHIAFGALGGWVGYSIWKPAPDAKARASGPVRKAGVARPRTPLLAGRIAWLRVGLGIGVAVAGYLSAGMFFNFLLEFCKSKITNESMWQDRVVAWEIQALAVLVGGVVAGFSAPNGLKQGLCVGAAVSIALMGLQIAANRVTPEVAVLTAASAFCLGLIGGWFGGQTFPPLMPSRRQRGLGPATLA